MFVTKERGRIRYVTKGGGGYIFIWHDDEGVQFGTMKRGYIFVWHDEEGVQLCLAR